LALSAIWTGILIALVMNRNFGGILGIIKRFNKLNCIVHESLPLVAALMLVSCSKSEELKALALSAPPEPPKTITIEINDYCPADNIAFIDLIVVNESAKIESGELRMDWDRDGLSNINDNDARFNIDYRTNDTNGDGYSDLVMYVAGIESSAQSGIRQCNDSGSDLDFDGLNDCEERLLQTEEQKFDSDGDMLPDKLELRFGMNPNDPSDVFQDADNDGLTNMDEVKMNTPIMETNSEQTNLYALKNQITQVVGSCRNFRISNIPVLPVSNGNSVRFYLIEKVQTSPSYFKLRDYVKTIERAIADKSVLAFEFNTLTEAKGR
jgi:hypothetical protein